jgi:hypothetical protein
MWKNNVEWGSPQIKIWRMRIACWMPNATNAHAGFVIIIAFPLQQWLYKRDSLLRYMYIPSLFILTGNVLTLLPVKSDYWLRYVSPSA